MVTDRYVISSVEELFSSLPQSVWSTHVIQMPITQGTTPLSDQESLGVTSSLVEEPYTFVSYLKSVMEDTPMVSSTPMPSYTTGIVESSVGMGRTISEEVTNVPTKHPLESILTTLELFSTTISPSVAGSMTSLPYSSSEYELRSSVAPDLSLESTENLVPATMPHSEQAVLPSYTVSSDSTVSSSDEFVETPTFLTSSSPLVSVEESVHTSLASPESTTEVTELFPSTTLAPTSLAYTDTVESSVRFTSLVTEILFPTTFPSESIDLETLTASVAESTLLLPSLTFSASTIDFESFVTTLALPKSTLFLDSSSFYTPLNTMEAPAFVPTESEEVSTAFSLVSSDMSAFVSQDSSSLFVDLETSRYLMETSFPSVMNTISVEVTPWPTINPTSVVSFTPSSSSDWTESVDLWEVTLTVMSESGIFYTSTFSGATTTLLPSLSELGATIPALSTYSFDSDHTSSAFIEETLQTYSVSMTMVIPTSMPVTDTPEAYTSVISTSYFISQTVGASYELSSSPSVVSLVSLLPTASWTPSLSLLPTSEWPTTLSSTNPTPTMSSTLIATLSSSIQLSVSLVSTTISPPVPSIGPSTSPTQQIPVVTTTSTPTVSTQTNQYTTTPIYTERQPTTPQITTSSTTQQKTTSSTTSVPITPPSGLTAMSTAAATSAPTSTRPTLLCDVSNPDPYLVTAVLSRGSDTQNITDSIKELLTRSFSRPVEMEVYTVSERFSFMVTSGPFVYTAFAVTDVLNRSPLVLGPLPPILSVQAALLGLHQRFRVQTVLQFVPLSVDVRLCTFSEQIQRGLSLALYEVRQLRLDSDNLTVQIVNISSSLPRVWKAPVTISYAVRDRTGFLNGSDVGDQLRNLSLVEFSFFLGYPVKQIAEPSQYPQLNISPSLKDTWLQTVVLDVQEQQLRDEAFQMEMERKLAQLISEALQKRRWKRASNAGSNTVQMVSVSRMNGSDDPVELIYFVEDQYGGRLAADKASSLINEVNIQRAAIILGYRLQGVVAQPLNRPPEADQQAQNLWIIVGVAVPVLVVTIIIVILYWKLCRTDKLDFQPDTMANLQQRQKLQAPNVKGFDFAKQHLGQHNKDEILVVHEPPPPPVLHGPLKDATPSENGDIPTPKFKSSTKSHKLGRHRSSRVTPSDAGSTASEPSSGRESGEETSARPSAPPCETPRRPTTKAEMPVPSGGTEKHSSASIFEHVDRMSRSSEAGRRLPSKIQLIAMQPMATPPMHGLSAAEREMEANKINREIQTTLRHKSEIEHHRNKIRLRAKRKGHYEFPLVDVVGMADTKERQRMYRRAQMQFDKILDPALGVPSVFIEPRKSSRSRRSPKQRRRQQGSSSPPDADLDRLIATDSDGTYKRHPGVSNSAYVSDPDLPSNNPTPVSDLGKYPGSSPQVAPPTQYVAPQPSIEEVRQTMQSLLDDAFALVAPSSHGPAAAAAVQSGNSPSGQQPAASTTCLTGPRPTAWGAPYPPQQPPHYSRFVDYGVTRPPALGAMTRSPGFSSGFLLPPEPALSDSQQAVGQYPSRMYPEDIPSVARPRPLGSAAGSAQIHQLTQVGIASRMGVQPTEQALNRSAQPQPAVPSWSSYYTREEETQRNPPQREPGHPHSTQDYGTPPMFRAPGRQPAPHLPPPSLCYPPASAEDVHPGHSSASLIKAIREELLRLSQKHVVVPTYHS
ncbi:LOW QUALITY PROTEIN: UPF0606 protein KIAA1549 homolog [Gastrophryne carolinensis]